MRPHPIIALNPCFSLEDLVSMSIDQLCPYYLAILTKVLHRGSIWNDVVIGFEGKFDLLFPLVQIKIEVEM